jgi:hypothetical protein
MGKLSACRLHSARILSPGLFAKKWAGAPPISLSPSRDTEVVVPATGKNPPSTSTTFCSESKTQPALSAKSLSRAKPREWGTLSLVSDRK